jgi:hypothetical protein
VQYLVSAGGGDTLHASSCFVKGGGDDYGDFSRGRICFKPR